MALIVAITAVGSIVGLELIPRQPTHTVTAAHTTTVSTAAAAPVSTTTATRRRCDTWGNRDRCTDCYGPDRAWLGISAPANVPSQGLMLIARSKTRCPLQTDKGSDLVSACSGVRFDAAEVRRVQNSIGAAFARVDAVGAEAKREQMTYLAAQPDPGPLLRTLLRLRHDLVMIGRAAAVPLPERFHVLLGPPLARVVETAADYLRAGRSALIARRNSPPLDEVEAALDVYAAAIATARRERLTQDLPGDVVERIFALGFALEQLHQNFIDLARCVTEFAQSNTASTGKIDARPDQSLQ